MALNWFESFLFGLFSGFGDVTPISAQAHRTLMLKFFGLSEVSDLQYLLIHLAIIGALYYTCRDQIVRMNRARSLAKVPKRKRKRPLDVRSMMDFNMLKTMIVPVILGLFFYEKAAVLNKKIIWIAVFLFVNGIVLYIPQFFPSGNRDSRTLSRVEGLLMGMGGAVSVLPGVSAIGVATSVGSICGVERSYCLNMALLMNLVLNVGFAVLDILGIISGGLGTLSILILIRYIFSAAVAFGGVLLGIKLMRYLAAEKGYALFSFYCWGMSLFTFILNLMA